jgi:transcription elongation factor Elf1
MTEENTTAASEIKSTDIVFDCPYCEKSLAIDYRGAGLIITCPDCGSKVQVPIPEGMELADIDSTSEEQEVRIIQLRQLIADAQKRLAELETEVEDVKKRRDQLEQLRSENVVRFEIIGRELDTIQRSLRRIAEVVESAMPSRKKPLIPGLELRESGGESAMPLVQPVT